MEETTQSNSRLNAVITLFGMNRIQAKAFDMYSKKPELLSMEELVSVVKDLQSELSEQKSGLVIGTTIGAISAYAMMTLF